MALAPRGGLERPGGAPQSSVAAAPVIPAPVPPAVRAPPPGAEEGGGLSPRRENYPFDFLLSSDSPKVKLFFTGKPENNNAAADARTGQKVAGIKAIRADDDGTRRRRRRKKKRKKWHNVIKREMEDDGSSGGPFQHIAAQIPCAGEKAAASSEACDESVIDSADERGANSERKLRADTAGQVEVKVELNDDEAIEVFCPTDDSHGLVDLLLSYNQDLDDQQVEFNKSLEKKKLKFEYSLEKKMFRFNSAIESKKVAFNEHLEAEMTRAKRDAADDDDDDETPQTTTPMKRRRRRRDDGTGDPDCEDHSPDAGESKSGSKKAKTLGLWSLPRTDTAHGRWTRGSKDQRTYFCMFCDFSHSKKLWLEHLKDKHADKNLLFCDFTPQCGQPFESAGELERHIAQDHKLFSCRLCPEQFTAVRAYRRHRKEVHRAEYLASAEKYSGWAPGPRSEQWTAPTGPRPARSRRTAGNFDCRVCGKQFSHSSNRTRHENETHTSAELKPYVCTHCGKAFKSKQCHRAHEKRHEEGYYGRNWEERCKWEGCNEVFFHLGHYQRHMLKHTKLYPFTCSICGLGLLTKQAVKVHEKGVHEEAGLKEECKLCGRSVKPRYMKWHMARHEGKTQAICITCNKVFLTNTNLLRHQRIHVQVKPHACQYCGKAFVQKSNMVSHEHTHTGTCPYKCGSCGKGFKQLTNMKKHQSNCSAGNREDRTNEQAVG